MIYGTWRVSWRVSWRLFAFLVSFGALSVSPAMRLACHGGMPQNEVGLPGQFGPGVWVLEFQIEVCHKVLNGA